jgi:hypothetical protein
VTSFLGPTPKRITWYNQLNTFYYKEVQSRAPDQEATSEKLNSGSSEVAVSELISEPAAALLAEFELGNILVKPSTASEKLNFVLLERAISELLAESLLGSVAASEVRTLLGLFAELPNASKASRKNFLFGTIPCVFIRWSNFWTSILSFALVYAL